MGEQQLKSLSCSLPSNQESLQQTKPTNFWMKRWKVPGDLQSTPGSKQTTSNEYSEQQSPVHQVEEVVEDISRLQLGTVIEEDVDSMDEVEQKTILGEEDVRPRPSTTTVIPIIPTVQHQQTIQHRERPTSNTTNITIFSKTSSIITSSFTTNTINPYYNFNNQLHHSLRWHSTGQSPTTFPPLLENNNQSSLPLFVIQNGYKIQFTKKPIPWRNQKKTTTVEDQHHINEAVQKFLDGGMIEASPTQNRQFLSKFFTLQETTKRRPTLDCQKLNSFIQVEHFKMEGVPALRELMEKDDYICKIDLKDAYLRERRNCLPIQIPSVWPQCSTKSFLQNHALCYRTSKKRRNSHHLLFGRYMHPGKDETRDGPGNEQKVSGLCVQQQNNDDISIIFEDYQPNEEDSTVAYFSKENVQMDSRSTREDDFHDSSSRRSSITHKIPTTGPVENIAPDSPELESNLQIVKYQSSGVTLVGTFTTQKNGLPIQRIQAENPKTIIHIDASDKTGREKPFNKRTRTEDDFVCNSAPRSKMQKLNDKDLFRQHNRLEVYNQIRGNDFNDLTRHCNSNTRNMQPAQHKAANLLDMVNRPSSFSGRCTETSMLTEGDVFIPTLEIDTPSTEEISRTKGKASNSSDSIMAQPILVSDDLKDEARTTTNHLENQSEMVSSRLAIINNSRLQDAVNWSDINQLVSSYVEKNESDIVDADKAFSQICNSLETICKKRRKHLALFSYCTDLLSFLKQNKNKKRFKTRFATKLHELEGQALDTQARQEGYNNEVRLAVIGGRGYANTLDKEISTEKREERYETDSIDSEREADPAKSQQEAVEYEHEPLLYCNEDPNIPDTETNFLLKRERDCFYAKVDSGNRPKQLYSTGLSSILDLIDLTDEGQACNFEQQEWQEIRSTLMAKYASNKKCHVPQAIATTWKIITSLSQRDNGFELGKKYITELEEAPGYKPFLKYLRVLQVCLNIMENNPRLLEKKYASRFTEYDYLGKIWVPLFDSILAINGSIIRLKSGESINSISTGNKEEQYESSKSVKGFKIDLRFIYDTEEDEYDVGAGEAAKTNNDDKLLQDLGKAIRESKDVLDGLLNIVMEDSIAKSLSAWFVQICGLQGEIASVHLAFNGLYVAVPQGKLKFPISIATMSDFLGTFSSMLLFVSKLEKCAIDIKSAIEQLENRRSSMGFTFNRARPLIEGHQRSEWMRPTWYSPPGQQQAKSQLPFNLFGREAYYTEPEEDARSAAESDKFEEDADEFGWIRRNDGWFNIHSKTFSHIHHKKPE
ncbi:hypothetical protein G6F26_006016 [Rhizopus arrhizus]|nr:hypothetical protein G6F24_001893 [Rhizopus arrhizus]KAG0787514.1 hypothetical protein G6F21_007854 [Rhizopus arrhizus]KAG0844470.1 hypothetical protein G6F18_001856 [Rhizopus arrhizus]KAG0871746.1 hypothetical protein G6F16_005670 [Rhizopus arrhizus]KAG0884000.1 hypothetical protein G6F15_005478 [Rhizopus arrhizus]